MTVRISRVQWPVGHGGFHTAEITGATADLPFRYVYDCGSLNAAPRRRAIKSYLECLGKDPRINLLVLSHLDEDHVNGLRQLLSRPGMQVDLILVPLLKPIEKLLAIARSSGGSPEFRSLVADPGAELGRLSPESTVFEVVPGASPASSGDGAYLAPDITRDPNVHLIGSDGDLSFATDRAARMTDSCAVGIGARYSPAWLLGFHLSSTAMLGLDLFRLHLAKLQGIEVDVLGSLDATAVSDLVRTRSARSVLRAAYRAAGVETNLSSISLLSGPSSRGTGHEVLQLGGTMTTRSNAAWLHTGDSDFSAESASIELGEHFAGQSLSDATVLGLPHHGAASSFHPSLLRLMPELRLAFAAASATVHRRGWIHPAPSVMAEVSANGTLPWVVSELPGSRLSASAAT